MWRCGGYAAPAATDTEGRASSRWRSIRRFEIELLTHFLLMDEDLENLRFESIGAFFNSWGDK